MSVTSTTLLERLLRHNNKLRDFKSLHPIKWTGDIVDYERQASERMRQEIAIMQESAGLMDEIDREVNSSNAGGQRPPASGGTSEPPCSTGAAS